MKTRATVSGQFDANYLTSKGQLIALNTMKDTIPSLQCLGTIDTAIKKSGNAGRHKKRVGQLWHSIRAVITKLFWCQSKHKFPVHTHMEVVL